MEKNIKIIIPKGADEQNDIIEVGINGVMSTIKKGVPLKVSMDMYLVLKRANVNPVLV